MPGVLTLTATVPLLASRSPLMAEVFRWKFVVLGDSAFDHCEVLGSIAVAVEKCQNAWCGFGIIKADMLAVCLPWCIVSPCSHVICGFQ